MSDCSAFIDFFTLSRQHLKATERLWKEILLQIFSPRKPSTTRAFRRQGAEFIESPFKYVWELRSEPFTSGGVDYSALSLYDLSSRIPILCGAVLARGRGPVSEADLESSQQTLEIFIQSRQRKGILESIRAIRVHGAYFTIFGYNKEDGLHTLDGGAGDLLHVKQDSQRLEKAVDTMKRSVLRQLLALCAQNECQVMSLWSDILEEQFPTLPDPRHGVCSCESCRVCLWQMKAVVETLPDGTSVSILTIQDAVQITHPTVVVIGCSASGMRNEGNSATAASRLAEVCDGIASRKSLLSMGRVLYVGEARGRTVRWYSYQRVGDGVARALEPLGTDGGKEELDAVSDASEVDSRLSYIVTRCLVNA